MSPRSFFFSFFGLTDGGALYYGSALAFIARNKLFRRRAAPPSENPSGCKLRVVFLKGKKNTLSSVIVNFFHHPDDYPTTSAFRVAKLAKQTERVYSLSRLCIFFIGEYCAIRLSAAIPEHVLPTEPAAAAAGSSFSIIPVLSSSPAGRPA